MCIPLLLCVLVLFFEQCMHVQRLAAAKASRLAHMQTKPAAPAAVC